MRRLLFKSLVHGPLTEVAPLKDEAAMKELAAQLDARPDGDWAERSPFERSMRDPATGVNWKYTPSTTCCTTWSDLEFGSSPRRATPTCCS